MFFNETKNESEIIMNNQSNVMTSTQKLNALKSKVDNKVLDEIRELETQVATENADINNQHKCDLQFLMRCCRNLVANRVVKENDYIIQKVKDSIIVDVVKSTDAFKLTKNYKFKLTLIAVSNKS